MRKKLHIAILVFAIIGSIIVASFCLISARDEVFYLCGNFVKGVARDSVTRQLDTGLFLRYEQIEDGQDKKIHVNSSLTLDVFTCTITLDGNDEVIEAVFE